jgi:CBS domain-containing protein
MTLADISIKDAAAQIFSRPCLFVSPTAPILQIATYLAIGPQIYADGLVVINEGKRPIGRISSKQIIFNIINTGYPEWLKITAEQVMDDFAVTADINSPLSKVLEIFDKTRFGFVPIIEDSSNNNISSRNPTATERVVASLSIRDILPLIAKMNIDRPIKDLSSPLISVDKNDSVRKVIDHMIINEIRNIGVREDSNVNKDIVKSDKNKDKINKTKLHRIINDRMILEFLLSHNGRNIMHANGAAGLANIDIINN